MDVLKAGAHKMQEAVQGKKADEKLDKATDPTRAPSDRIENARDAAVADSKANAHACKAECSANDHKH